MGERWCITISLNEPQAENFQKLLVTLRHSHHADVMVRKDAHNNWFQTDWLRHASFERETKEPKF